MCTKNEGRGAQTLWFVVWAPLRLPWMYQSSSLLVHICMHFLTPYCWAGNMWDQGRWAHNMRAFKPRRVAFPADFPVFFRFDMISYSLLLWPKKYFLLCIYVHVSWYNRIILKTLIYSRKHQICCIEFHFRKEPTFPQAYCWVIFNAYIDPPERKPHRRVFMYDAKISIGLNSTIISAQLYRNSKSLLFRRKPWDQGHWLRWAPERE